MKLVNVISLRNISMDLERIKGTLCVTYNNFVFVF